MMKKETLVSFIRPFKPLFAKTLWREGSVRTILFGPCKGLRYRIFPDMGLSPIYGGWEEDAQRLMVENIRPGCVVYDIGGNYGIHTLLMARLVKEEGHVYSFEPLPEILSELEKNIALNSFTNASCVKLAVNDETGVASFFTGDHVGAGHLADAGKTLGNQSMVETITLDDFVFERNNRPPDFIKLDVEGAEGRVLSGGLRALKQFKPILLVDLHTPEQDVAVGQILLQCRYEAYNTEDGRKVERLDQGWPTPDGLWGQIIAFPAT